jgi:hypothetical protein
MIENNETIKECWNYYKTMISYIRNDPTQFNTTEVLLIKFERLLVSIDQTVIISEIFKGCIEQNYEAYSDDNGDDISIPIRSNELFFDEMLICIKLLVENSMNVIGT